MRVVIDGRYLSDRYGGPAMYSRMLIEHLAEMDTENNYTCLVHESYADEITVGANFKIQPDPGRPLSLRTLLTLHRTVDALKPDVFHALFPVVPPRYRGRLIVTVHDLQPLMMPEWTGARPWPVKQAYDRFYAWMYPLAFRKAARLLCVSDATRGALLEHCPDCGPKSRTILSGLPPEAEEAPDTEAFEKLASKHNIPDRFVLFIGSTRPNKNLPMMLEAFARLRRQDDDFDKIAFVLVLTRDRFFGQVEEAIERLSLHDSVRVIPPVAPGLKRALYAQAACLFFATQHEGFGFPILEAQAQGTPVVAADAGSLPEISGRSTVLVDPEDPDEMARGLRRVLSDRHLAMKLVEQGRENIRRFEWENTARATLDLYRQTAATRQFE